jgi:phosphatidylserine/phosphatidylglycerophosphate/cardiolipin synthase-like enzyme
MWEIATSYSVTFGMKKLVLASVLLLSCANQDGPSSTAPQASGLTAVAKDAGVKDASADADDEEEQHSRKWEVRFSPKGGCTDAIVAFIRSAKKEVLVQAYSFTSKPIAGALVEKSKKVPVRVILDSDDVPDAGGMKILLDGNVEVWTDAKHPISHNKVIVVDGKAVETGSFNYTAQAESNAENCLIVKDKDLAKQYADNWATHLTHSTRSGR